MFSVQVKPSRKKAARDRNRRGKNTEVVKPERGNETSDGWSRTADSVWNGHGPQETGRRRRRRLFGEKEISSDARGRVFYLLFYVSEWYDISRRNARYGANNHDRVFAILYTRRTRILQILPNLTVVSTRHAETHKTQIFTVILRLVRNHKKWLIGYESVVGGDCDSLASSNCNIVGGTWSRIFYAVLTCNNNNDN